MVGLFFFAALTLSREWSYPPCDVIVYIKQLDLGDVVSL